MIEEAAAWEEVEPFITMTGVRVGARGEVVVEATWLLLGCKEALLAVVVVGMDEDASIEKSVLPESSKFLK